MEIPGIGNIQAIEDFIISNNLLPLGALVFLFFCVTKKGWGWQNFLKEADTGEGLKFPKQLKGYLTFLVPIFMLVVFIGGYIPIVSTWLGLG